MSKSKPSKASIIGMGCRLPGVPTLEALWTNLAAGNHFFAPLPQERWDAATYAGELPKTASLDSLQGAVIDDFKVDWRSLRLPPLQVERMHRMERLALATMCEALSDASITLSNREWKRCQVFIAATTLGNDPLTDHGRRIRRYELQHPVSQALLEVAPKQAGDVDEIIETLFSLAAPPIEADSMMTSASLIGGRLSNLYDFQSGHIAVDAEMCSSLAALERAVATLTLGDCDLAIVCALSPLLSPATLLAFGHRGYLSSAPPVPFATAGSGTWLGEGTCALVLSRPEETFGRRVYANIDGVGCHSVARRGGDATLEESVFAAANSALQQARCEPSEVAFVESRACGLARFDTAELRGLAAAYRVDERELALGLTSCVPNLGYLQAAAGLVAVVKSALGVFHGQWLAQRQPAIADTRLQGVSVVETAQKLSPEQRVAVSDCGITPLSYHAVLSRAEPTTGVVAHRPPPPRPDFAIVGTGVLVPRAGDVETFWKNIVGRITGVRDLPPSRWDVDKIIGAEPTLAALLQTRLAGTVDFPDFVPERFRIPPASEDFIDPAVKLALLASEQALVDAGFQPGRWNGERVKVIFGQLPLRAMEVQVQKRVLFASHLKLVEEALGEVGLDAEATASILSLARSYFDQTTPALSSESLHAMSGLSCATSVAKAYDFGGGVLSVDGACASALAALEVAAQDLTAGKIDTAVVGAVAYNLLPEYYITLSTLGALSPRGTPAFHQGTDGFVPAEGAGVVVVKRLADAQADRDRIYAVIKGIGYSSDGRGVSIFAPNTRGEQRAVRAALEQAEIAAKTVDYVEAHGTGTIVGDATEIESYAQVYGERDSSAPLSLGTVKSQIGHLSSAAGMVGLIKMALAIQKKVMPPSNIGRKLSPDLKFEYLPFELATEPRSWVVANGAKRRAGVSAFGLGGINYHVVLEEPEQPDPVAQQPVIPELLRPVREPARGQWADRFSVELCPLSLPQRSSAFPLDKRRLLLLGSEQPLVDAFALALREKGAEACHIELDMGAQEAEFAAALEQIAAEAPRCHGVLDLRAFCLKPAAVDLANPEFAEVVETSTVQTFAILRLFYDRFCDAAEHQNCYLAVTGMGGDLGLLGCRHRNILGAGLLGLLKGLKQEVPQLLAKTVDFRPQEEPRLIAEQTLAELCDGNDRIEVAYCERRYVTNLSRAPFDQQSQAVRHFGPGDTVFFSGGGRGVVFECAAALAKQGVQVIVTGRTPVASGAEPWLAMDQEEFKQFRRQHLQRRGQEDPGLTPVQFEHEFAELVRQRELYSNLRRARQQELPLVYKLCDVTSAQEIQELLAWVREEFDGLSGVVHGAMVEWSRTLLGKKNWMIEKTLAAKIRGLLNLMAATAEDQLKIFCCFGSGAGRFGNRGQTDYSAANALMAALLRSHALGRRDGAHCVTVNWTGWKEVGAAASPHMAELIKASGVTSISSEEGVFWFLNDLFLGRRKEIVIFEERMLHDWPFLGSKAEGAKERSVQVDDRGFPLVSGQWPLVDYVLSQRNGCVRCERLFDPGQDVFLREHLLYENPVVPATFGCEMLAEAAALTSPGWWLERGEKIAVDVPIKFHRFKPLLVRTQAEIVDETAERRVVQVKTFSNLFLRGRVLGKDRLHFHGFFQLRRGQKKPVEKVVIREREGMIHSRSIFDFASHPVELGFTYQRGKWVQIEGNEVLGTIRAPRQRDVLRNTAFPVFALDPLVMDTAIQIAANWDGFINGYVSIPFSIGSIVLGGPRGRGENARVSATMVSLKDPDIYYDIVVTGEEDQLIMRLQGVHLRRVAQFDRPQQ